MLVNFPLIKPKREKQRHKILTTWQQTQQQKRICVCDKFGIWHLEIGRPQGKKLLSRLLFAESFKEGGGEKQREATISCPLQRNTCRSFGRSATEAKDRIVVKTLLFASQSGFACLCERVTFSICISDGRIKNGQSGRRRREARWKNETQSSKNAVYRERGSIPRRRTNQPTATQESLKRASH